MRVFGLILIVAASLWPLYWYVPLAMQHDAVAMFSQYLGSVALILMGINHLAATRWPGLESVFGGLDRIYVLHKWLGVTAMVTLGLHDIIDAEVRGIAGGPLAGIAEDIGEISLYGLLVLVIASIITFIPYHLWKWTHRFIGAFFAMGAFHYFFIEKPFANTDPLGLYVSAFCVLGIVCYIYMLVIKPMLPSGHRYTVTGLTRLGAVTQVELSPKGRGMRHTPGQFAFLSFKDGGLGEEHPFTLSSAPRDDRSLRFSVKDLGDFTQRMGRDLSVDTEAVVTGPFGHFRMPGGRDPQVWIGAGIGITPFLAFAASLKERQTGPVTLYYCVRETGDVAYAQELTEAADANANFTLVILNSQNGERLSASRIAQDLGDGITRAHVHFCGPKAMRQSLRADLTAKGLKGSRFHYEEFEMRSGIGLRKLAGWLLDLTISLMGRRQARGAQAAQ